MYYSFLFIAPVPILFDQTLIVLNILHIMGCPSASQVELEKSKDMDRDRS